MDSQFRHGSTADNALNSSLGKSLNNTLKFIFFTLGISLKLVSSLEENGSLGFSLVHLEVGVEDCNLGIGNSMDGSLRLSDDNHTSDDLRISNSSSENLLDSNVINTEFICFLRKSVKTRLGDQIRQEILKSVLF